MEYPNSPAAAPKTSTIAVRYGLLSGLIGVIFSLMLFLTKMDQSPARWLGLLISIAAIYLAHVEFKKQNGGYMEYSQGLSIGTLLSVVAGVLSAIFIYVYVSYIDPTYLPHMLDVTRTQMEAKGNMTDDQIEQAMSMTAKFMTPGAMVGFTLLGSLFFGFVLSLIVSAVTKHSTPQFE